MGEVSYSLMRQIIGRKIRKEVGECVQRYRILAESYSPTEPGYTEKVLSLSVELEKECKKIALDILSQYDGDLAEYLKDYKDELKGELNGKS